MTQQVPYQILADAILVLHFAVVIFNVAGLLLVVVGNLRHWRWVNAMWFRLMHLAAIAVVVTQAWLGEICPLTTLEMWLRSQANQKAYSGSFIEYWLQRVLFYDAEPWVFLLIYSLFGLLVIVAWVRFPPKTDANKRK
jgi:Protein of Unknown function (DUF2784)